MAPANFAPKLVSKLAPKSAPKLVLNHPKICNKSSNNWLKIGFHNWHKIEPNLFKMGPKSVINWPKNWPKNGSKLVKNLSLTLHKIAHRNDSKFARNWPKNYAEN
jgi:hypothetical protein